MPYFDEDFILKVSESNDIVGIISQYVPLEKKGKDYIACCPFHNEKTPSFHVNRENGLYHCFGCGAGGNLYSFLMAKENMTFPETVEYLAQKAGLPIPQNSYNSEKDKKETKERKKFMEMHRLSANFYYEKLSKSKDAQLYLKDRGLNKNIIFNFGIGYSPNNWNELTNYLRSKGYSDQDLLDSGLASESKGRIFDRFRGRIMFPIQNVSGDVIAFGARQIVDNKDNAKYLNTAETKIFSKKNQLFNLNRAKSFLKDDPLVLVEGYMDVVALASYGINNTAAALGTAFTKEHKRLIRRYTDNIVLCFDGDSAGEKATFRAIDILDNENLNVKVVRLPKEHDPDSFIRENGTQAFKEKLKDAVSTTDFKINVLKRDHDLSNHQELINFVKKSAAVLTELEPVDQDFYINQVSKESGISPEAIRKQINNLKDQKQQNNYFRPKREKDPVKLEVPKELVEAQKRFLYFCYIDPENLDAGISEEMLTDKFNKWFYSRLKEINEKRPSITKLLLLEDDYKNSKDVSKLLTEFLDYQLSDVTVFKRSINIIQKHYRDKEFKRLSNELINSEESKKQEIYSKLAELKKKDWVF